MNPPAPSPRPPKGSISPTTGTLHRRAGLNPPAPSPLSSHRHHEKARDKAAIAAAAVAKIIKSRSRSRYEDSSINFSSSEEVKISAVTSFSKSLVMIVLMFGYYNVTRFQREKIWLFFSYFIIELFISFIMLLILSLGYYF